MEGDELKKELLQLSADLDRLATANENGASWESAAHLRNRSNFTIRSLARKAQVMADSIKPTENRSLAEALNMGSGVYKP